MTSDNVTFDGGAFDPARLLIARRSLQMLHEVVGKIALRNFPLRLTFELDAAGRGDCHVVWVVLHAQDRDSGRPCLVVRDVERPWVVWDSLGARGSMEVIYQHARALVDHELAEAWHYDGERVFDPHRKDDPQAPR